MVGEAQRRLVVKRLETMDAVDTFGRSGSAQRCLVAETVEGLRSLDGLRGAIVHKDNRFAEAAVLEDLDGIKATLRAFAERVEGGL